MKLNKFGLLFIASIVSLGVFVSCEDDSAGKNYTNSEYVSFADVPQTIVIADGETVTVEASIFAGHTSNVDRVLDLRVVFQSVFNEANPDPETGEPGKVVPVTTVDQDDVSVPATVTIPAGAREAKFNVTIHGNSLDFTGKQIAIGVVPKVGLEVAQYYVGSASNGDYEIVDKRLVIKAVRRCDLNSLRVEVVTDGFGSETTWELYDSGFNYVDGITGPVGGYSDGNPGASYIRNFCLAAGDYTFVAYDSEGDGMNDGTNQGYIRLYTVDAAGVETEIYRTATFASDDFYTFTLN